MISEISFERKLSFEDMDELPTDSLSLGLIELPSGIFLDLFDLFCESPFRGT